MSINATSPERHVALYAVSVDGEELDENLARAVTEVRIQMSLRVPDMCTVTASFEKAAPGRPEPLDAHPFDIGRKLEVRLGARETLTTNELFSGEIVTLEPQFTPRGVSLRVRAFDHGHTLMRSRRVRTFQNQTAGDIVEKIVSEAGFDPQCEQSGDPYEFIEQDNETDWDFIWRLADRVGYEFVVADQTAMFRKPTSDGAISLVWPTSLHSFAPRLTAVQQVKDVTLRAQDPKTKDAIDVTVSSVDQVAEIGVERASVASAFGDDTVHIATEPVKSSSEATAVAQALLDKLANGYVAAEGTADGNPGIRAGTAIQVSGVGDKFSGTYRVASATHVLRGGSTYETHFVNSIHESLLARTSGKSDTSVPAFGSQLVLGIVTNNDDPDGMGRIRIRYPALADDMEGAWARIATASAGNERGMLMLPVVGEEVLVGFEHDDTTRPYVLGSLFNGQDTPGDDLVHDRDGSFALKSDADIYAESKGDLKLTSRGKLVIEVADDVEEKYQQDLTSEVEGGASLKATQAFAIEGQTVSIKAQTEVTLEGATMLTLKSGGTQIQLSSAGVQITGPLIQLG